MSRSWDCYQLVRCGRIDLSYVSVTVTCLAIGLFQFKNTFNPLHYNELLSTIAEDNFPRDKLSNFRLNRQTSCLV